MKAKAEFRDRPDNQVAVLDALVERNQEGMTVLELRSHTGIEIDNLETALEQLKADNLISATQENDRTLITVDDRVLPEGEPKQDQDIIDRILERLPF
ncbi:MAG: DUF6432 family protein [Halobacteriaceae archaeon]